MKNRMSSRKLKKVLAAALAVVMCLFLFGAGFGNTAAVVSASTDINGSTPRSVNLDSKKYAPSVTVVWNDHIYSLYDELTSWDDAKEICELMNGYLVSVTSAEEWQMIYEQLIGAPERNTNIPSYWLGATDEENEGEWKWLSGEAFEYTNWAADQPDNMDNVEHYLNTFDNNRKWNDSRKENRQYGFICECDFASEDKNQPQRAFDIGNNYYELYNTGTAWHDANAYAKSKGGHLAYINSAEEQAQIWVVIDAYPNLNCWIGASDYGRNKNDYVWGDGSALTYSHWNSGEPNSLNYEDYVQIIKNSTSGEWNDGRNLSACSFLVEYENGKPDIGNYAYIPVAAEYYNGHTYTMYDELLTWHEAKAKCESMGGHLVTITSAEEQDFITNVLCARTGNRIWHRNHWIGLTDEETEGVYKWITGEVSDYTNWAVNQPGNRQNDEEDYVCMFHSSFWNDAGGTGYRNGFVCEFDSIIVDPVNPDPLGAFISNMYRVCLGREPAAAEINYYKWLVTDRNKTGPEIAELFVFSDEFKQKNYCDRHYTISLYNTFMSRDPSEDEIANWVWRLQSGDTREDVFNRFSTSFEFNTLCRNVNVPIGTAIGFDGRSTKPGGYCSVAGCHQNDGKIEFARRLYTVCLDRDPDQSEVDAWHYNLVHGDHTGVSASRYFIFSPEFLGHNYNDEEYVEHLYAAMMGREPSTEDMAYWVWRLTTFGINHATREQVFNEFAATDEFKVICQEHGVVHS